MTTEPSPSPNNSHVVVLVEAGPADARTGAPVAVRLAGGGTRAFDQLGHGDWLAGVAGPPRIVAGFGFAAGGWTGGAIPQTAMVVFSPAERDTLAALARHYWDEAPVRVWTADDGATPALAIDGTVATAPIGPGGLTLTIAGMAAALSRPLVTARFAGTGGLEGDADATGGDKRRSWGRVFNVEARLLRKASNRYEVGDPAFPLQAIPAVRDKGREGALAAIGWQGSTEATLAALEAAEVPRGGAVVAPSIAQLRWWTQPAGPLTVDVLGEIGAGYVETVATIADRIVAAAAGGMAVQDLASADRLRPGAAGIHVTAGETAAQALDRLLLGASLLWIADAAGSVTLLPWAISGALAAEAWAPGAPASPAWTSAGMAPRAWAPAARPERLRSRAVERVATFPPVRSRRVGYRRNHRPHSPAEIAADILAGDVRFPDGATAEQLQPAEAGAQVTRAIAAEVSTIAFALGEDGQVADGQLPRTVRFTATAASANVSREASWSVETTGGIEAKIDNAAESWARGVVTITAVTGPGTITARALVDGVFLAQAISVTTKGALADKSQAGTGDIAAGAVTGTELFSAGDVPVTRTETVLIETPAFRVGDGEYGRGIAQVSFFQDCSTEKDAGWRVRVYVDTGAGFGAPVWDQPQGFRTANGGDTFWAYPTNLPIPIEATGPVRVRVTAQAVAFAGGDAKAGATARYTRVLVFRGAR